MATEAMTVANAAHTKFGVLLTAMASEHESLWSQTQFLFNNKQEESRNCASPRLLEPEVFSVGNLPSPVPPLNFHVDDDTARYYKVASFNQSQILDEDPSFQSTSGLFDTDERYLGNVCSPAESPSPTPSDAGREKSTNSVPRHADRPPLAGTHSKSSSFHRLANAGVMYRLQARLGVVGWDCMFTAHELHVAVRSLGLEMYTLDQLEKLVQRMSLIAGDDLRLSGGQRISEQANPETAAPPVRAFLTKAISGVTGAAARPLSHGSTYFFPEAEVFQISLQEFADFLTQRSERQRLGSEFANMCVVLKEVLLSGDANRLVAELTCVRIDDLAMPPPRADWDDLVFEPLVGLIIVLNGITIGLQTDSKMEDWKGWFWVEQTFMIAYLVEMLIRIKLVGVRTYYGGVDGAWGVFDTFVVLCGIVDTMLFILVDGSVSISQFSLIRTVRLTRITRLFRIFRLGFLRELNIMIKGLLAGCRTLFWALVLLFFAIYIIAVFTTSTLGRDVMPVELEHEGLFTSVPRSMLTCFRCFVGDCNTATGFPIVKLLSDSHGWVFIFPYLLSFTMVTLGLFNLIMALYVEITMAAAKSTEQKDRGRAHREALRVAHTTKQLLKKFCAALRIANPHKTTAAGLSEILAKSENQDVNEDQTISKELFLLIVQDQEIQRLMNDLDIPPDRAHLFDVLDADNTGDLHVTELVHGLLKVRGEAKKSDVTACTLKVQAVQGMLQLLEARLSKDVERIMDHLGVIKRNSLVLPKSIWDMGGEKRSGSKKKDTSGKTMSSLMSSGTGLTEKLSPPMTPH